MRKPKYFENSRKASIGKRTLLVEHLEHRELLAADLSLAGAPMVATGNGGIPLADSALVSLETRVPQANEFGGMAQAGVKGQDRGGARISAQQAGRIDAGDPAAPGTLSTDDAQGLLELREEEKLARDVYLSLADMSPLFANIAASESRHMDAVGQLIAKYGLEDPVGDNAEGVFTNAKFAALYDDLVEAGSKSLTEAYKVGAMIEEMDIKDLQDLSTDNSNEDIASVYENLTRGSRNHLRAFATQIEAAAEAGDPDATYEPQFLTQAEFDAIVNSPLEQGNREGGDRQRGRVAVGGPTGDPGNSQRLRDRSSNVATGRQQRPGDRQRDSNRQGDRDQACVSQEDLTCEISQQIIARDRLFAGWNAREGI